MRARRSRVAVTLLTNTGKAHELPPMCCAEGVVDNIDARDVAAPWRGRATAMSVWKSVEAAHDERRKTSHCRASSRTETSRPIDEEGLRVPRS